MPKVSRVRKSDSGTTAHETGNTWFQEEGNTDFNRMYDIINGGLDNFNFTTGLGPEKFALDNAIKNVHFADDADIDANTLRIKALSIAGFAFEDAAILPGDLGPDVTEVAENTKQTELVLTRTDDSDVWEDIDDAGTSLDVTTPGDTFILFLTIPHQILPHPTFPTLGEGCAIFARLKLTAGASTIFGDPFLVETADAFERPGGNLRLFSQWYVFFDVVQPPTVASWDVRLQAQFLSNRTTFGATGKVRPQTPPDNDIYRSSGLGAIWPL